MTRCQLPAWLALLLLLGSQAAAAGPVSARTAQLIGPSSPEPPLADAPAVVPSGTPCPIDPPVPVVAIRVRVPAAAAVGQELEYRLRVENTSPAAAHHVLVRNPLPANARFVRATPEPTGREPDLTWELGTLEPGKGRDIVLVLAPTGDGDVRNCARVQFEHGQCVTTRLARPELALEKRGPRQGLLHDFLTYQIIVTNTGSAEATGVELTDTLPEGLQHKDGQRLRVWELGTLAPGQSRRVEYQVLAQAVGEFCNKAVVVAVGGVRKEATGCVTVTEPKLEMAMTGPKEAYVREPTPYQITVTNPGSGPVTNLTIANKLPPQTLLVSANRGGRLAGDQVQWALGTLAAGASRTVQLVLQSTAPGEVRNQAVATADRGLKAEADARTTFAVLKEAEGVHFSIVDEEGNKVEVGGTTRYTITVLNQGNVRLTNVRLVATVPAEMDVVGSRPAARLDGRKVVFEPFNLPAGGTASYQVQVRARKAGDVRFEVEMTADGRPEPVRKQQSTTIFEPEREATPQGRSSAPPGGFVGRRRL